MGKPIEDRSESTTLEPIIINPRTVNNYKDATVIDFKSELSEGSNIILDDGIIEKVPGTTKQNNDAPGNNPVYALHRAYGKTTEKVCLRLSNGSLKSGPPAFATTPLGSLANKITPFVNIKGRAYGINETDGLIRYDPKLGTAYKSAIVGPQLRKKIAFFETDETWTGAGGAADTSSFRSEEWSGNASQGRKITVAAASSSEVINYNPVANLDLSVFDNSKASGEDDIIRFWTKHTIRANIDYIYVTFATSVGDFFNITLYQSDLNAGDYEWTEHKIKKGSFVITGIPAWTTIDSVGMALYTNANGGASVTFDYMYLESSNLICVDLRKDIFSCEDNIQETWSADAILTNTEWKPGDQPIFYTANRSVSVFGTAGGDPRTATCALTAAVDLTKWVDGSATLDSDHFYFYVRCNDISEWTDANCLTMNIGLDAGNYYTYTWLTKTTLGIADKENQWVEVKIPRGSFGVGAGAPNWAAVDYISFTTSDVTGVTVVVYLDYLSFRKTNNEKQLATMEAAETWTFSTTENALYDGSTYIDYGSGQLGKNGVTQGASCLKIRNSSSVGAESYATLSWTASVKNFTVWDDASASTTADSICFDIYSVKPADTLEYIEIWFDCNSLATFVDAYKFRFTPSSLDPPNDLSFLGNKINYKETLSVPKSSFERIGTAGGWATIGAVKIIVKGSSSAWWKCYNFFDNLKMRRRSRQTGTYYYKYCFVINDIPSALSEISDSVMNQGNDILIQNIKTSQDTRVTGRWIFRLGGTYTNTWMLLKEIGDNTTTQIVDSKNDNELLLTMGDQVPQGWINIVKGNNLCYEPQSDRTLYWGDPDHKNYVWCSNPGYPLAVNADGYREFNDEVMSVIPWYGQDIVIFRNKMQKIDGSIYDGQLNDLPINVGCCSYWAAKPMKNVIPFVGWDNVYLMDGYQIKSIGDEVKSYFKGRETYLSSIQLACCKDTIYIACKEKTGTPTYNDVVLRYYIPTASWTILPDWNVNIWSNWDQMDDQNQLYYGDSVTGHIYSINSATYDFDATAITTSIQTGWLNFPESELAVHHIQFKAKGTAASILTFEGYKNLAGVSSCSGTITLTTSWVTYTIGPKNIHNILRGDNILLKFIHATASGYVKIRDIVVFAEKIPKRITLNEVTIT